MRPGSLQGLCRNTQLQLLSIGHLEWEVEAIVAHRVLRHGMKYRVKWKDTPQEQWLPRLGLTTLSSFGL